MLPGYRKIRNLGHKDTRGIFDGPVVVQEKVDGSQISFGIIDGDLFVRSKGTHRDLDGDAGTFQKAVDEIKKREHLLQSGFVYRGEYLRKPKHNHLAYDHTPKGHIALWEVERPDGAGRIFSSLLEQEAAALDLDVTRILHDGSVENEDQIKEIMDQESFLGGCKMEGVVIKTRSGLYAKVVCKDFREKQKQKKSKKNDPIAEIADTYRTEARWRKAIQHLRDEGKLTDSPRDIGPLIKEIQADIMEEHGDEIKQAIFEEHRKALYNGFIKGFPQWYQGFVSVDVFDGEGE